MAIAAYSAEMVFDRAKKLALEAKKNFQEKPFIFAPDHEEQDKANYFYRIGKVAQACMYSGARVQLTFEELENLGFVLPEDEDGF